MVVETWGLLDRVEYFANQNSLMSYVMLVNNTVLDSLLD
jgi:hypothetical protein